MRTRKVGRWVVRLVAIAAFGVAATIAGVAVASTDEPEPEPWEQVDEDPPTASPDGNSWD
jgi:hypothetical protein